MLQIDFYVEANLASNFCVQLKFLDPRFMYRFYATAVYYMLHCKTILSSSAAFSGNCIFGSANTLGQQLRFYCSFDVCVFDKRQGAILVMEESTICSKNE